MSFHNLLPFGIVGVMILAIIYDVFRQRRQAATYQAAMAKYAESMEQNRAAAERQVKMIDLLEEIVRLQQETAQLLRP